MIIDEERRERRFAHDSWRRIRGKSEDKGYLEPPNLMKGKPMEINSERFSKKGKRYVRRTGGGRDKGRKAHCLAEMDSRK